MNAYIDIQHSGIKGMKWGVRRYQNKDGSLTPAGKKRYNNYETEAKNMTDQELRSKINRMNLEKRYINLSKGQASKTNRALDLTGKATAIGSDAGKIAKDGYKMMDLDSTNVKLSGQGLNVISKSASSAKKINNIVNDKQNIKRSKAKLDSMTDKDLQDIVNRMDLEQQYSNLKRETVTRGKVSATEILDIVGSVVAIGASATAMAVSIYNLKKGKTG